MKYILGLISLIAIGFLSGCASPGSELVRDIKAAEINITHSTPWTTLNVNAKDWESHADYDHNPDNAATEAPSEPTEGE